MSSIITPTVGVTYKFSFEAGYNALDGVYTLIRLMTYDEYLADNRNLLDDFYTPNRKSDTDLDADIITIRNSKIMKLTSPDKLETDSEIYAPLCFLKDNPDYNVNKYSDLGIITHVGVTNDPSTLTSLAEAISEHLSAEFGIEADPKFVVIRDVYLTDSDYADIIAERDSSKKKIVNYFSECKRLHNVDAASRSKLAAYEELLITQIKRANRLQDIVDTVPLVTINFDVNGGTGSMDKLQVYQLAKFSLPACTMTPPEGYTFIGWSSNVAGSGEFSGQPGDIIDASQITNSVTLYAIWTKS